MQTIRVYGLVPDSIVDGPGLRYSIFTQGCGHNCDGCHNPESQPKDAGTLMDIAQICDEILANKLIAGVTFSGGEPFDQAGACAKIASTCKNQGLNIWAYTGYLLEDLLKRDDSATHDFLQNIDVLVDGPFVKPLHSHALKWRGSSNQRIIDIPKTLSSGKIIEWTEPAFEITTPPSW